MKSIVTILLLFTFFPVRAQFAVVEDKDGYTNIRKDAGTSAAITGKVRSGEIVYCMEKKGEWYNVDYYTKNYTKDESKNGFIHQSRVQLIEAFTPVPGAGKSADSIFFRKDALSIGVRVTPFILKNNRIGYKKGDDMRIAEKINGRSFWGTDGAVPDMQYKHISCWWNGKQVPVPDSAINDVFNPNLHNTRVWYDIQHERWFITATNSDGAGGYEVMWMFEQGVYKKRYVFYGS